MRAILTIAQKDLRVLRRDKAGFFWVLGFPFLIALFFGSIASGGNENRAPMKIVVADLDGTDYSRAFAARLERSEALETMAAPIDSARELVRQGRATGYVALHPGMGSSLGFGFGRDSAAIEIGLDPSRRAEAGYLKGLVTQALFESMMGRSGSAADPRRAAVRDLAASLPADTTLTPQQREDLGRFYGNLDRFLGSLDSLNAGAAAGTAGDSGPGRSMGGPSIRTVDVVEASNGPRSAFEVTFPSGVMWALIGVCMSFAVSIVHERVTGTFLRLRLAPISRAQVLAGKGLAAFVAAIATTSVLLAFAAVVFKVRVTNLPGLLVALGASAFCFVGLMMLIATLGRTHQAVSGAGWAILLVMSMTGGGMIPLIAMPAWMQSVSNFSLVKWGVLAVEGAIWRGFTWSEMLLPVGILVGVGAVAFFIGARALTRAEA